MPAVPKWSLEAHLEAMKNTNITKSILSISSPGTHLVASNPSLARSLTRDCNAFAADLKRRFPDQFGFWASLPLPDIQGSLDEIAISIAEGADGFGLMTNYHGVYLGDEKLEPVWRRLDQVGATLFIHPTTPCMHLHHGEGADTASVPATPLGAQYPVPVFEFLFDTARAIIHLFSSGFVAKYPNITYIIPHAGGCLPPLWTRMVEFSNVVPIGIAIDRQLARRQLAERFYFDIAGFVFNGEEDGQGQLQALVQGLGIRHERLLYGSDFPFTAGPYVRGFAERMVGCLECMYGEGARRGVYEGNARKLLERKMSEDKN